MVDGFGYRLRETLGSVWEKAWSAADICVNSGDFIEGGVPKRIGAKHYMALARQANKFYPIYAEYLAELRQKASLFKKQPKTFLLSKEHGLFGLLLVKGNG